ncbi:MAG: 3D domain-containing protein [bacterium]
MYTKRKFASIPVFVGLAFNLAMPQLSSIKNIIASSYDVWNNSIFNSVKVASDLSPNDKLATLQGYALVAQINPYTPVVASSKYVIITAYSSTPDQTDSTPFTTALGTQVHDGIIACNFLKFGTRVQIPSLFGDKVFVVEDRMARKNDHKIDIWFETREQAMQFGVRYAEVEILVI